MNHLKYITKKCHEANPKLLEPSFGCYFLRKKDGSKYQVDSKYQIYIGKNNGAEMALYDRGGDKLPIELGFIEILGHPIQLSDILMAIKEEYAIHKNGRFMKAMGGVGKTAVHYAITKIKYDLSKPLSEQSEETLKWIATELGYQPTP